jgi:hypothetical protein
VFGHPTVLFQTPNLVGSVYDVSPDGKRFVFITDDNTNPATIRSDSKSKRTFKFLS